MRVKLSKSCLGHVGFKSRRCLRATCLRPQRHVAFHAGSRCQCADRCVLMLRVDVRPHLTFS